MRTIFTLALCALLFAVASLGPRSAVAAGGLISERTYKRLSKVHELMADERYEAALKRLDSLRPSVEGKSYAHALVLQTYAYLYLATEQNRQAMDAFARCLALDALPEAGTKGILYALAQLQMAEAEYGKAVATLEKWLALERQPTPEAHALAGAAYTQVQRYSLAIKHLKKAIAATRNPKETWYRQLLAVYFEAKRYRDSAGLLEEMVTRYPRRKDYWLQLSGVYRELDDDARSLATLELAHRRGLLVSEPELLNLVNYFLFREVPEQAARVLEGALRGGVVRSTAENWRLLSDAWLRARELRRALAALERAAELSEDPELHLRRAQLSAESEDWPAVLGAIEAALSLRELQRPGKAHLLKGIAHLHLKDQGAAVRAFRRAKGFDDSRGEARQWLDYLEHEQATLGDGTPQLSFDHARF